MTDGEVWYRYDAQAYSSVDEYDRVYTFSLRLERHEYAVIRHTPKGVWVDDYSQRGRFVLTGATKRWACPTDEEARASFVARKRRQIKILENNLSRARESLALADDVEARVLSGASEWEDE